MASILPKRSGEDLAGIENAVRIEGVLARASSARSPRRDSSIDRNGAFAKPMPCSPLIEPSSATTPANSTRSASCARRDLVRVAWRHHDVDVDVAVAGVAEARDPQAVIALRCGRRARTARGMRPFGTTTSWLNLSDAIIFSDSDSSRRTRQSSCRSRFVARAKHLGRAGVAARALDARGFFGDRLAPGRPLRAAAARRSLRARAIARSGSARPPRANRRRSTRAPPARRARG